jgi:hypothetical protein
MSDLIEAEQATAAERAAVLRAERALQARLGELERHAVEIRRELDEERAARERSERVLESMRRSLRAVEGLVGELRAVLARLKEAAASAPTAGAPVAEEGSPAQLQPESGAPSAPKVFETVEIADALAVAAERLRARVQEHPGGPPAPAARPAPHKHSASLITRARRARKQRRER